MVAKKQALNTCLNSEDIFLTQKTIFLYFYMTVACLCDVLQSVPTVILHYLILLGEVEKKAVT